MATEYEQVYELLCQKHGIQNGLMVKYVREANGLSLKKRKKIVKGVT